MVCFVIEWEKPGLGASKLTDHLRETEIIGYLKWHTDLP